MLFGFVARGVACLFVEMCCVGQWLLGVRFVGEQLIVVPFLRYCVERFVVVMFGVQ